MFQGNDKGQMMVLETIFFTATVILSLVFLYQLSPSSIVSDTYTDDLKAIGDDALYSIYEDVSEIDYTGYPSSSLIHYLIANEYGSMVSDLRNLLPSAVMYNVYVSNGTDTMFWCNSFGEYEDGKELPSIDPVTVSHCIVPIHPKYLAQETNNLLRDDEDNDNALRLEFSSYEDYFTYELQLRMWYI